MKKFLFLSIFLSIFLKPPLFCREEPMVIRLETETTRIPVYVTHFNYDEQSLDKEYVCKLEKVLQFDLENNGLTTVLSNSPARDSLAASAKAESAKLIDWKGLKVFYLIKVSIQNNHLSASLFAANSEKAKSLNDIPLKGELAFDRHQIHLLADALFKALFGKEGVASTRFIFTRKTKQGSVWNSEVWEADYDGENARQLTTDSGYAVTPVYLPPKPGFVSGGFFFTSYKNGQPKIYYQSFDENGIARRLSYLRGNQLMPAINRQRDKLAFICDITGNPDLFIQSFSPESGVIGKPYQIFAAHKATQGTPTFSPDGSQIAFVSNKDGFPRVYIMDVPDPGASLSEIKVKLITKRTKESSAPAWSPDGSKIAYCAAINGVRQVWIYDFSTKEEKQLTQGPGNKENPTWGPDSLHLIFNSSDANACELYLINLNQIEAIKISSGVGEKRFPSWGSR